MFKLYFLLFLVFFACRAKYDTSKAIPILPTQNIIPDANLQNIPLEYSTHENVVSIGNYKRGFVKNVSGVGHFYDDGHLYYTKNKRFFALNLQTFQTTSLKHHIKNAKIAIGGKNILLFDEIGNFAVVEKESYKILWSTKFEIQGLASEFSCVEDTKCYALTLDGHIAIIDISNQKTEIINFTQPQNIISNEIYKPLVYNNFIIFAVGNSEFAIFDSTTQEMIAKNPFIQDTSVFNINIINKFYKLKDTIIISHINGAYAFNISHGVPLWEKKFIFEKSLPTDNYLFFFNEEVKKIFCIHSETGEVKWAINAEYTPIGFFINTQNELIITEKHGIHILNAENGELQAFKKLNLAHTNHFFAHDHKLHYIKNHKVYTIQ